MCYKTQLKVWGDNDATEYALVLQHCPEEFQVELKNQEEWVAIDNAMSVVRLLIPQLWWTKTASSWENS